MPRRVGYPLPKAHTQDEYRVAVEQALKDGKPEVARQIAQNAMAAKQRELNPVSDFGAQKRSEVEGSLAGRRMLARQPPKQDPLPLGNLSQIPPNIATGAFNMAMLPASMLGAAVDKFGFENPIRVQETADALKIPEGDNTVAGRVGQFTGAGAVGGLHNIGRATANAGARGLAGSTARNVTGSAASALGSVAGGNLAQRGGFPEIAGELAGSFAPQLLARTLGNLSLTRPGPGAKTSQGQRALNSKVSGEAVKDARSLGLFPAKKDIGILGKVKGDTPNALTAGIASPNGVVKFMERTLASIPGGMRQMHEFARGLNANLTAKLQKMTGPADPSKAGRAIESGVNDRVGRIRAASAQRYGAAERAIDPSQTVKIRDFRSTIADIQGQTVATADDVIAAIRSGKESVIPALDEALAKMTEVAPGVSRHLTFREADAVRKAIGETLSGGGLLAKHPQEAALKRLYGALSDDISNSLSGQQKVLYDFAKNSWKKDREVIDKILGPTVSPKTAEKVFKAAFSNSGENPSILREVYRGLDPSQRKTVTKTFIAKLGRAGDETLVAAGDTPLNPNFNMGSFITRWRKLPSESKDIIFAGQKEFRKDMETFTRHVDRILETNKALANPSQSGPVGLMASVTYFGLATLAAGTAGIALNQDDATDALVGTATGVAGLLAAAKGVNSAARLMQNPRFMQWMARGTRVEIQKTPEHFARLTALANTSPEMAEDIAAFMGVISEMTDERKLFGPRTGEQ